MISDVLSSAITITVNEFYVNDCVEFMQKMDAGSVDLTVTSPPYDDLRNYNGYSFNFEAVADGLFRVTKMGGIVVWVVGDRIKKGRTLSSFRQALYFQEIGFSVHDVMIYRKKIPPLCEAMPTQIVMNLCLCSVRDPQKHLTP